MALTRVISQDQVNSLGSSSNRDVTELELLTLRRNAEEQKKALQHWRLLRDSITNVRKSVETAQSRDRKLVHGIHHDRKLNHASPIKLAMFMPQKKEYLTSDGENVSVFHEDGRKKAQMTPDEHMDNIIYASQTNQFVGWLHKEKTLFLMNEQFEIKSQSETVDKIHLGAYNSNTGEMVTVGPGFITCWAFRYGARHLIPRKTTTTEFEDANMFSLMVLEETASRSQRMFFACANGVVVYNVFEGKQLVHRKELHVRPITAITFFNPLKYLITGAMDGCIKVWDSDWCVNMVFVGHSGSVRSLAIYPHGPLFISSASDCTIRVWSMETCDEVDKTSIAEPVTGLRTSPKYDVFFTFAGKKVDLWRLNHLYHIHTNIGHRVQTIKLTSHPSHPVRAVLMCRDSSVRIVSPPTGAVLTTLVLPTHNGLTDAAYAIAENLMFTVSGNGDIIKCRTDVNPCEIVANWRCPSYKEACNYLLVYEYVVDLTASTNIWDMMKRSIASKTVSSESRNRTLLLGGRKDGYICVYNWDTGAVQFKVEAHGSKGVLNMIANSKLDQLISAGMDNIIKVWRLYPFAEEALAPLMSFYCAHTPAYMSTIKSNLCVAFQDPGTATFNTVIYNLPEKNEALLLEDMFTAKNRHDHKPDEDHLDMITGLTSCARMKLFASSSMDGTIRIWNDENKLVRLLTLNAMPNSIGFCSSRGDLLVGIGLHLFHIPWHRYLPKPYLRKMVSMRFLVPKEEEALPYEEARLVVMDKNDVKRLKGSHASFKVTHFADELSQEEQDEVMHETRIREKAFSKIEMRENELGLIRDGGKTACKRAPPSKRTQRTAMKNYMKLFYNKPRIQLPVDDPYPMDKVKDALEAGMHDEDEEYRPETAPINFFSDVNRLRTPGSSCHGISPVGFVPNSVLVKILYPPPSPPPDPASVRPYRPPALSAKQLSEIRALKKSRDPSPPRRSVTFNDKEESFDLSKRTLQYDLDEDEEDKALESEREDTIAEESEFAEKTELELKSATPGVDETDKKSTPAAAVAPTPSPLTFPPPKPKTARTNRLKKAVMKGVDEETDSEDEDGFWGGKAKAKDAPGDRFSSKFRELMEKPPSPKPEELEAAEEAAAAPPPVVEVSKPVSREAAQPSKPITKLVSRPRKKLATPPPPPSPTPPPPPTPLPDFIKQFIGTEWFEKYFPNCNEVTLPKPWNADTFVNMVMKLLRFATFPHKTAVAEAITLVHTQELLSEASCRAAQNMLLTGLNHHTNTPSCAEPEQKVFILAAIKGLQSMGICDKEFMVEMLVQFLDGDREVRSAVLDILNSIGLQDPHRQLTKELDSWDIWNIEEADRKKDLKKMCSQWLDRWMTSYKLHIKDAVDRLQKGQNLHGRMRRGSMAPRASLAPASRRGSVMPDSDASTAGAAADRPPTRGSLTVAIDRPDMALAEHATYFEAINYFCEMMTERELEALRRGELLRGGKAEDTSTQVKNTVLVLPKIAHKPALVRLGETHTSKLRQSRDTAFTVDFQQITMLGKRKQPPPGQLTGFVSCNNLPTNALSKGPGCSSFDYQQITMLGKGKQPPPGTLTGFVPCINLPMKPVYLNPFPSPIDAYDQRYAEPILITLKTSQKYFLPATSIVPMQVAPSS